MAIVKVNKLLSKKYSQFKKNFNNTIFLAVSEHYENLLSESIEVDGNLFSKELLKKLITQSVDKVQYSFLFLKYIV